MREILKIVNFYVRDRSMGEILRRSVLTKAGSDLNSEKWDDQKWNTTHSFLLSSFGVKTDIIRD